MTVARLLSNEFSEEVEDLKRKLADSRGALKKSLEAKFTLTDQVAKLTTKLAASDTDIEGLKARCGDLDRREEARLVEMSQREEKILKITQERDDTITERDEVIMHGNNIEHELIDLKDYILSIHEEGFNQAICQEVLLYGVPVEDNRFDIGKDVFQSQIIPVDDMPAKGAKDAEGYKQPNGKGVVEEEEEEDSHPTSIIL